MDIWHAAWTHVQCTQFVSHCAPVQSTGLVAYNVTLPANRFWLFLRANVGESLHTAYVRVTNTLLILAQVPVYLSSVVALNNEPIIRKGVNGIQAPFRAGG